MISQDTLGDAVTGPHAGQPVLRMGAPLASARAAMVLLHGRGATARDILDLAAEWAAPDLAFVAPQAAAESWYPHPFLAPLQQNEPWLSSALAVVGASLASVEAAGVPPERVVLLGFSQGACLALEYAARHARRYGGVAGLSGGLIGPDGTSRDYSNSFAGTPVFLGCSDTDFHIPAARVRESAAVFARLGGDVTLRLYPDMDHTVNADEIAAVRALLAHLAPES